MNKETEVYITESAIFMVVLLVEVIMAMVVYSGFMVDKQVVDFLHRSRIQEEARKSNKQRAP